MSTIFTKGVIRGGRVELDDPVDLPDGTLVVVSTIDTGDEPMTEAEIARVLAAMDKLQPLDLTADELADWERERSERKALEKARFAKDSEKLRTMWDDPVPP